MGKVSLKAAFKAPARAVWRIVRDFGTIGDYLAGIRETSTQGSGVGALRTLTLENGARVVERLEKLDDAGKTLSYSVLETRLPMKGYLATMTVREQENGVSELSWESTFEAAPEEAPRIEKIVARLYQLGFKGLKRMLEKGERIR